jgi:hypothetical protein
MTLPDPRRMMSAPFRRTLDALLLRWVSIYVLAASVVVGPVLCDFNSQAEDLVHIILPFFLAGFIVFHLFHRRTHVRGDGWQRAFDADPASARFALMVATTAAVGVLAALGAIICPHGEPMALEVALGIWLPIVGPLYACAVWLGVDCSLRQLERSADAADSEFRNYWRRVAERAPTGAHGHR